VARDPETLAIYIVLLVAMAPVAIVSWFTTSGFSGGDALALGLACLGAAGVYSQLRRSTDFPRARLRRSRQRRSR
jgi:uncharacterized membrane protein YhhN